METVTVGDHTTSTCKTQLFPLGVWLFNTFSCAPFFGQGTFHDCNASFLKSRLTSITSNQSLQLVPVTGGGRSLGRTLLCLWSKAHTCTSLLTLIYSTFISIVLRFCLKFVFFQIYIFFHL